jgi:enoyl-CoA hydratase
MMMGVGAQVRDECDGRTRENLRRVILDLQDTLTSWSAAASRCWRPCMALA